MRGVNSNINGSYYVEFIYEDSGAFYVKTSISAVREPPVFVDWVVYKPEVRGDRTPMESRTGAEIHCFWVDDTASGEPDRDDY